MSTMTEYIATRLKEQKDILELFPSKLTNNLIITPIPIVTQMLDSLPQEVWNSKTTFLDPACKSGRYLLHIFYRLMTTPSLIEEFPDERVRRHHILTNQLYGIGVDNTTTLITMRALYSELGSEFNNIKYIPNYLILIKNKDTKYFTETIQKEFNTMKFDVIISNPPYQESIGDGARAKPIYGNFFEKAIEIKPRIISFITPLRWCSADDNTSKLMRKCILTKQSLKMVNYSNSEQVFDNTSISGGVGYFVIDKNYSGETLIIENGIQSKYQFNNDKLFIQSSIGRSIVSKLQNQKTLDECIKIDSNYFGLDTNDYGYVQRYDIFVRSSKSIGYLELCDIPKNKNEVKKYKVITGAMRNSGTLIINVPEILKPNEVCTRTYTVLESFETQEQANNFVSYVKTKLFRFLISITLNGQMVTKKNYQLIPIQDFSHPWTDQMLYEKYNLTQEEINYIEQTIKPMN